MRRVEEMEETGGRKGDKRKVYVTGLCKCWLGTSTEEFQNTSSSEQENVQMAKLSEYPER